MRRTRRPHGVTAIAARLGLSKATVSKAINARPDVSRRTRERVLRAAARLGYSPNFLARALALRRTWLLGLVVPFIRHGFFLQVARWVIDEAARDGYRVIFDYSCDSPTRERSIVEDYVARCVDGLIVCPCTRGSAPLIRRLRAQRYPLVLVEARAALWSAPCVGPDLDMAGYLAARALLDRGHRAIGFLAASGVPANSELRRGILRAIHESGAREESLLAIEGDAEGRDARACLVSLVGQFPNVTGIVCGNPDISLAARAALDAAGVDIPRHLSIVTLGCGALGTFVNERAEVIASRATQVLLAWMRERAEPPATPVRIPPELVEGDSIGQPRPGQLPGHLVRRLAG